MVTMNLSVGQDSYASCIMVMSGAHVFHLLITLMLGVAILIRARRGLLTGDGWHARVVSYWWYWVAVSAVLAALTTTFTTI
jgi:heme/copper-type cytochrome/quinol oxidase subunit 3